MRAHVESLGRLDKEIVSQLEGLLNVYNMARDAALLKHRVYPVEAAIDGMVARRVEETGESEKQAAAALAADPVAVSSVAVDAHVPAAELQTELRAFKLEVEEDMAALEDRMRAMLDSKGGDHARELGRVMAAVNAGAKRERRLVADSKKHTARVDALAREVRELKAAQRKTKTPPAAPQPSKKGSWFSASKKGAAAPPPAARRSPAAAKAAPAASPKSAPPPKNSPKRDAAAESPSKTLPSLRAAAAGVTAVGRRASKAAAKGAAAATKKFSPKAGPAAQDSSAAAAPKWYWAEAPALLHSHPVIKPPYWIPYDDSAAEQLECALVAGARRVQLSRTFVVDVQAMEQKNAHTGYTRRVLREE